MKFAFSVISLFFAAQAAAKEGSGFPQLQASQALQSSKAGLPVDGAEEATQPYDLPPGYKQNKIVDRKTLLEKGLFPTCATWDMISFACEEGDSECNTGSIFVPCEVSNGAGVFRYDVATGEFAVLLQGKGGGNSARTYDASVWDPLDDEFTRLDPATYTPWGTLLTGEETTGGRLFEIQNPWASNPAGANIRWLTAVPIMAHEGIRFDSAGNLYTVDENNSGSVYKFVPSTYGDLSSGQAFVLKVDSYDGSFAGENWNSAGNTAASRDGVATWVPLTDASGVPLTTTDPFLTSNSDTGGRAAGDEVGATPYGRPEDMVISPTSGKEILYFTATSEPVVYSVELNYGGLSNKANVKKFVSRDTINLATGAPVGSELASPDNLAVDENGLIYVIEDQGPPNSDVWQAVDADGDGVAESVARFLTQGITGSEPTGLIFDPNTKRAIIAVQHPSSGNDAIWEITLGERNGHLRG